jgi:hypothetical protein
MYDLFQLGAAYVSLAINVSVLWMLSAFRKDGKQAFSLIIDTKSKFT